MATVLNETPHGLNEVFTDKNSCIQSSDSSNSRVTGDLGSSGTERTVTGNSCKVMDNDLKTAKNELSGEIKAIETVSSGPPVEDDVPPNFFDDFMNEDFIDGLNVVDTWEGDEARKGLKRDAKPNDSSAAAKRSSSRGRRRSRSPRKRSRSPRNRNRSPRNRSRSPRNQSRSPRNSKHSNSRESERERRDPNKTQRDILRDKDRCAKDQKAKLISEKLRVVETGLVPPGMEMEVDITQISETQKNAKKNEEEKVERTRNAASPIERKPRKSSPTERRRSPLYRPPRRLRSRSRTRSPRRRPERRRSAERNLEGRKSIDRRLDERKSPDRRSDQKRSPDRRSDQKRSPDRRSGKKRSPDRRLDQRKSIERHLDERSSLERLLREKRSLERRINERKSIEKHFDERKSIERRLDESRSVERRLDESTSIERRLDERKSVERRSDERKSIERRLDKIKIIERRLNERRSAEKRLADRRLDERREKRRRSPSRSPRRRRRSKSRHSDLSDREKWLRRRSRSRSPGPKRNKSFLQELDDKLAKDSKKSKDSFLNELKGIGTQPLGPIQNFMPAPVPPPQNYVPQTLLVPPRQEYDQQFFIGQPELMPAPHNFNHPMPHPVSMMPQEMGPHMMPLQPMQVPYMMGAPPVPQPVPMPNYVPIQVPRQEMKPQTPVMSKQDLSKLFNDKKITLSDFLSMTGKFTDKSRPVNIQNKIKDCQDIINELSADGKAAGRFTVRKTTRPVEKVSDVKNQSPFKKIPVVRFQYTTRGRSAEDKPTMGSLLTKLFQKFGKEIPGCFEEVPKEPTVEPIVVERTPPPAPILRAEDKKLFVSKSLTKTIFCQTDRYKCSECEARNSRVMVNAPTQTGDILTYDVACQVGPEDLPKATGQNREGSFPVGRNQSLASMTPAQLMARARGEFDVPPDEKRNDFDRYRSDADRVRGHFMFERDRGTGSLGTRERLSENQRGMGFGNMGRPSGGQFEYQSQRLGNSWSEQGRGFNSRMDEEERNQFRPPPLMGNQLGQMELGRGNRRF